MRKNNREQKWMEIYAPPGISIRTEVNGWLLTIFLSTLWSMGFLLRYVEERNALYVLRGGRKVLMKDAVMPTFMDLTEYRFELFYLVLMYCVFIAAYHYFYHYQGSKMMYLMKRLPNKWEVHVRCLLLPTAAFIISLVYMSLIKITYYAIYLIFTPRQCLPL